MNNRRKAIAGIALCVLLGLSFSPANAAGAEEFGSEEADILVQATGDVAINAANFPDANFRKYILDHVDLDGTMSLSESEVSRCKTLSIADSNIKSLVGIEHFTELTALYCSNNGLTNLDVSKNTALKILECGHNNLSSLDVSKNRALTDLFCMENNLNSLDISRNTALTSLNCTNNNLSSLDISSNTALTSLSLSHNKISRLDVSRHTALTSLGCTNNNLSSLDVSKNVALTFLSCGDNKLTSLDVSKNTALITLVCYNNQISSLDVSNNTALKNLYCEKNKLNSLDVTKNGDLVYLHCYENRLSSLDVSKNALLVELDCHGNELSISSVERDLLKFDPYFNPQKVSQIKGVVLKGTVLSFPKGITEGSYVYDCGGGKEMTVAVYMREKQWIFTDVAVNPGHWKYENVKYVYNNDLMGAIGATRQFQPDSQLTRAMFATVLYRMAGEPAVTYNSRFTDVAAGQWYSSAVLWAKEKGIVDGYLDGRFGINDNITREQIAKMLCIYGKTMGYNVNARASIDNFTDKAAVSNWAVGYVQWAVDAGMISGKPNENATYRLDPKGQATRAECAKMLTMFLQKYK